MYILTKDLLPFMSILAVIKLINQNVKILRKEMSFTINDGIDRFLFLCGNHCRLCYKFHGLSSR